MEVHQIKVIILLQPLCGLFFNPLSYASTYHGDTLDYLNVVSWFYI